MDPFVSCPYNAQHRVPRSRIQRHIVKCEQTHPPLAICPYNATHRFHESLIKKHVSECPSKEQFLLDTKPEKSNVMITTPQPIPQKDYISPDDPDYEFWDD